MIDIDYLQMIIGDYATIDEAKEMTQPYSNDDAMAEQCFACILGWA